MVPRDRAGGRIDLYDVFLSYHSRDSAYQAAAIEELLGAQLGRDAVFRGHNLDPGADWNSAIADALQHAAIVLVIIGPAWREQVASNPDGWVATEIAAALGTGTSVVPVLLNHTRMPTATELPGKLRQLATRKYVRVRDASIQDDVDALSSELRDLAPGRLPSVRTPTGPVIPAEELALGVESFTSDELSQRGVDPSTHALIELTDGRDRAIYPAFQFDRTGQPIPMVVRINDILDAADDPWGVADWWLGPNLWVAARPVDLLGSAAEQTLVSAAQAVARQG